MTSVNRLFLIMAAIAALIGMFLGGAVQEGDYDFKVVHVHLLLFGWVSNAIYGLFYSIYIDSSETRLAWFHFIIALMGSILLPLSFYPLGGEVIEDLVWTGATFPMLSAAIFIYVIAAAKNPA